MNERIKELDIKSKLIAPEYNGFDHTCLSISQQRFVELIVRECIQVCADRGAHHDGLYSAWADDCSKRIGKHFGVEE